MNVKLQGAFILFQPEDVMIGGERMALLADIDKVVTIEPGEFAQIATPITFSGDGNVIALIHMHAGRLAHALDDHLEGAPEHGQYFIPQIGTERTVVVDVVNETGATVMIRPSMQIGILTLVNLGRDAADEPVEPAVTANASLRVSASFKPKFLKRDYLPAYSTVDAQGVDLRADLDDAILLDPGATTLVETGFTANIPSGFEGRIRSGNDLHQGATVANSRVSSNQPVSLVIHNTNPFPITIRPGDCIANYVFAPIAAAELVYREAEIAGANPASK